MSWSGSNKDATPCSSACEDVFLLAHTLVLKPKQERKPFGWAAQAHSLQPDLRKEGGGGP